MTNVTLVYPYFRPVHDNSIFRLPPLGLGYVVSYLRQHDVSANLVDCTFMNQKEALQRIQNSKPDIIGVYSMFSMKQPAMHMAKLLRDGCEMLVVGGPLPTLCPEDFLSDFDVAAVGEGEKTMLDLVRAFEIHRSLSAVKGIVFRNPGRSPDAKKVHTRPRELIEDLDSLPFPARDQLDHESYKRHYRGRFGYTTTSIMTSRGCPFNCDFCSRAIFGNRFRARSADNVVDEIESVQALGYERIWFGEDGFTLDKTRLLTICDMMIQRQLHVDWECLSRVDTIDRETASKMRQAGCVRVFFGLESGNNDVLALMKKHATVSQARRAVLTAKSAGIHVGAFFMVGYPGETNQTILDTLRFASSLPLDYLSFTVPYPIPGTALYDRVKERIQTADLNQPKHLSLTEHKLVYSSSFSEAKLKFAIIKGLAQHYLRRKIGSRAYSLLGEPLERLTDSVFCLLR